MYYHKFPSAPVALISGISAACRIPTIVDARVGRDGSVYLDILETEDFAVGFEELYWLADFCGVTMAEIHVEPSTYEGDRVLSVTVEASLFDFTLLFPPPGLPGEEDSEEWMEALAALAASRRE